MTDKSKIEAINQSEVVNPMFMANGLTGLFDEMRALMAVMPGAAFDTDTRLLREDETEAMFDNMPV